MKIKVQVTQQHIDESSVNITDNFGAKAMRSLIRSDEDIYLYFRKGVLQSKYVRRKSYEFKLPRSFTRAFKRAFKGLPVEPFNFVIDIDERYTAEYYHRQMSREG